jgi:hypothetical protein
VRRQGVRFILSNRSLRRVGYDYQYQQGYLDNAIHKPTIEDAGPSGKRRRLKTVRAQRRSHEKRECLAIAELKLAVGKLGPVRLDAGADLIPVADGREGNGEVATALDECFVGKAKLAGEMAYGPVPDQFVELAAGAGCGGGRIVEHCKLRRLKLCFPHKPSRCRCCAIDQVRPVRFLPAAEVTSAKASSSSVEGLVSR